LQEKNWPGFLNVVDRFKKGLNFLHSMGIILTDEERRFLTDKDVPLSARQFLLAKIRNERTLGRQVASLTERNGILEGELVNFAKMSEAFHPTAGEIPHLEGIDVYGSIIAKERRLLSGISHSMISGGDHLIWFSYPDMHDLEARITLAETQGNHRAVQELRNNYHRGAAVLVDVSGHQLTDSNLAHILHQALKVGEHYELLLYGEPTANLLEVINSRTYRTSAFSVDPEGQNGFSQVKGITMLFGEFWEPGKYYEIRGPGPDPKNPIKPGTVVFRYISAGHPYPYAFSREKLTLREVVKENSMMLGYQPSWVDIDGAKIKTPPMGFKGPYVTNTVELEMPGDFMLLFTDGFSEPGGKQRPALSGEYDHGIYRDVLIQMKDHSAREIHDALLAALFREYPNPDDDITLVVVKRTK
jgi:hypothetical protein